jgi:hypothetical protein
MPRIPQRPMATDATRECWVLSAAEPACPCRWDVSGEKGEGEKGRSLRYDDVRRIDCIRSVAGVGRTSARLLVNSAGRVGLTRFEHITFGVH